MRADVAERSAHRAGARTRGVRVRGLSSDERDGVVQPFLERMQPFSARDSTVWCVETSC